MSQSLDFSEFFEPVNTALTDLDANLLGTQFGQLLRKNTTESGWPNLDGVHLVFIGIREDRRCINNKGTALAPNAVRKNLYSLFQGDWQLQMADLGDICAGFTPEDTDYALKIVVGGLLKKNIIPIIIGGGQELTFAQYLGYEKLEQTVNIVSIDSQFNLGSAGEELNSKSFLSKIILQQPNYLFNFSNIGYQTYFVEQSGLDLMQKLNFDIHRLGQARSKMDDVEPIIRNADLVSFDIGAIRQSEAPGNANASPNGFFGDEACQLSRYAGISAPQSFVDLDVHWSYSSRIFTKFGVKHFNMFSADFFDHGYQQRAASYIARYVTSDRWYLTSIIRSLLLAVHYHTPNRADCK